MICKFCETSITLWHLIFNGGYVTTIDGTKDHYHPHCWAIKLNNMRLEETRLEKELEDKKEKKESLDLIIKKLDLLLKTGPLTIEYQREMEAQMSLNNATIKKTLEEASKILLWLELKAATKDDMVNEDIGLFDPVILELVKKYTGRDWKELVKEIKNKSIKSLINQIIKDEEKKK